MGTIADDGAGSDTGSTDLVDDGPSPETIAFQVGILLCYSDLHVRVACMMRTNL